MQKHTAYDILLVPTKIPIPSNCSGISTVRNEVIFWFPDDDMTAYDVVAIEDAVALHKYGLATVVVGADTYIVTITTTQATVTPTINGVALELMNAVGGEVTFEVEVTETFTIGSLLLDMEEVTYYVD